MHRPLGTFESAATLTNDAAPFVVVVVLELDGGPSLERLRSALATLQRRHPLLRVKIVQRAGRFWYEPLEARAAPDDGPAIPLRPIARTGDGQWRTVAEQELDTRIDSATGPLVRCTYLSPPEPDPPFQDAASGGAADPAAGSTVVRAPGGPSARCEILLTFHHAIMDAASGATVVRELLALCDPAVALAPSAEPLAEQPVLPPVETLFPPSTRGLGGKLRAAGFLARQVADELAYRWRTRGGRKPPIAERARCRILPVALSRDETVALVEATRRRRVTLNGALGAAFLQAVDRHLYAGRARALRYMTFADLRPYLDPPVAAGELGSFIAMMRYTARMEPLAPARAGRGRNRPGPGGRTDRRDRPERPGRIASEGAPAESDEGFWRLAQRVTDQVAGGARRGDKLWSVRFSEAVMRMIVSRGTERMASTALSYTGITRVDGVRAMRAFVSNFALGPEYTAQARIFEGELQLDILYLDVDMDAARARTVAEEVLGILRRAGVQGEAARP